MAFSFVGGGVGSALRFLLSKSLAFNPENHFFPYGTLLANVLSSFILGIVIQNTSMHRLMNK
ncbi:MAG: CrcB family protein [Saprospiraceae bacterium]|nr:CrcB family protein [Saprospiraceae bacterium]